MIIEGMMQTADWLEQSFHHRIDGVFDKHRSLLKSSPGLGGPPLKMFLLYISLHSCTTC
jgi:hypothetical protein